MSSRTPVRPVPWASPDLRARVLVILLAAVGLSLLAMPSAEAKYRIRLEAPEMPMDADGPEVRLVFVDRRKAAEGGENNDQIGEIRSMVGVPFGLYSNGPSPDAVVSDLAAGALRTGGVDALDLNEPELPRAEVILDRFWLAGYGQYTLRIEVRMRLTGPGGGQEFWSGSFRVAAKDAPFFTVKELEQPIAEALQVLADKMIDAVDSDAFREALDLAVEAEYVEAPRGSEGAPTSRPGELSDSDHARVQALRRRWVGRGLGFVLGGTLGGSALGGGLLGGGIVSRNPPLVTAGVIILGVADGPLLAVAIGHWVVSGIMGRGLRSPESTRWSEAGTLPPERYWVALTFRAAGIASLGLAALRAISLVPTMALARPPSHVTAGLGVNIAVDAGVGLALVLISAPARAIRTAPPLVAAPWVDSEQGVYGVAVSGLW